MDIDRPRGNAMHGAAEVVRFQSIVQSADPASGIAEEFARTMVIAAGFPLTPTRLREQSWHGDSSPETIYSGVLGQSRGVLKRRGFRTSFVHAPLQPASAAVRWRPRQGILEATSNRRRLVRPRLVVARSIPGAVRRAFPRPGAYGPRSSQLLGPPGWIPPAGLATARGRRPTRATI